MVEHRVEHRVEVSTSSSYRCMVSSTGGDLIAVQTLSSAAWRTCLRFVKCPCRVSGPAATFLLRRIPVSPSRRIFTCGQPVETRSDINQPAAQGKPDQEVEDMAPPSVSTAAQSSLNGRAASCLLGEFLGS